MNLYAGKYPPIRYPSGRNVHYGGQDWRGRWVALCGWVPRWHDGAVKVDEAVSCTRCLAGPRSWRFASR